MSKKKDHLLDPLVRAGNGDSPSPSGMEHPPVRAEADALAAARLQCRAALMWCLLGKKNETVYGLRILDEMLTEIISAQRTGAAAGANGEALGSLGAGKPINEGA